MDYLMRRLEAPGRVPYGGEYRITDPLTKVEVRGANFKAVTAAIYRERQANGAPCGLELENEIEQWCCQQYPAECIDVDGSLPSTRSLDLASVLRGTRVIAEVVARRFLHLVGMSEDPLVDQGEANRRAEICKQCRFSVFFHKPCTNCLTDLDAIGTAVKGSRVTPHDEALKACAICHCQNSTQVWVAKWLLDKGITQEQKTAYKAVTGCWKQ